MFIRPQINILHAAMLTKDLKNLPYNSEYKRMQLRRKRALASEGEVIQVIQVIHKDSCTSLLVLVVINIDSHCN